MSGVIGALIGSFVKPPFVATGGNETLTQNGWRYHIFRSSGTFTITSGEAALQILTINGGGGGGTGAWSGSNFVAGSGGSGGQALIGPTTAPVSTSFAVTVGGAGGSSSVVPARSTTAISGGGGGQGGIVSGAFSPQVVNAGSAGGSVALYNTRGVPWSLLSLSQAANAGGGGGGAYNIDEGSYGTASTNAQPGGNSGYNSSIGGASGGSNAPTAGASAAANSGGGGGGGGVRGRTFYGYFDGMTAAAGGNGGSGIVIIAYPVA